ncbi:hypothetical protein OIU77_016820 [Salix suchowensis]|uniref:Uncharacterized protein n=1 Tax=Salix suchowensis TaxID=1278906 RepID=A0ABQ8ZLT4_9ROSI|nr:hypothetical protein OIU77_016820 [Salix suchowensis]
MEAPKIKGSTSQLMGPVKSRGGGLRGGKDEGGDATLGDEKRKIYTGPNPLHNSSAPFYAVDNKRARPRTATQIMLVSDCAQHEMRNSFFFI